MPESPTLSVITTLKFSDRSFRFEIAAYRKLTPSEAKQVLKNGWNKRTKLNFQTPGQPDT